MFIFCLSSLFRSLSAPHHFYGSGDVSPVLRLRNNSAAEQRNGTFQLNLTTQHTLS